MKTDTLFYRIFLDFPEAFFELVGLPITETANYQFTSREVKQLSFRLDGLFYPQPEDPDKPFYLVEVQFQPDNELYYRIFAELGLFLRQYQPLCPWYVVIIYPNRSIERRVNNHFEDFLNLSRVKIIYLDEVESESNSLGLGLLRIIIESEELAIKQAKLLVNQVKQQLTDETIKQNFLDLLQLIIVYKLPTKSREEIEAMFELKDFQQTRFYQDVKAEGEISVILRLLKRKFTQINPESEQKIRELTIEELENLGEALLDFESETDLRSWLGL